MNDRLSQIFKHWLERSELSLQEDQSLSQYMGQRLKGIPKGQQEDLIQLIKIKFRRSEKI